MEGVMTVGKKSVATQVKELVALKAERDQLEQSIKQLQTSIIESMEEETVAVQDGDRTIKATRVQSYRTVWDEAALRTTLGQYGWLKVSSRVLDKKKLEAKIVAGDVDPDAVASCASEVPSAPYLKIT